MMRTRNLTLDAVIGSLFTAHAVDEERIESASPLEAMALYDAAIVSPHRESARPTPVCVAFKETSGY